MEELGNCSVIPVVLSVILFYVEIHKQIRFLVLHTLHIANK